MRGQNIIIGTRGSKLSLAQTNLIKDQLQQLLPETKIEIQVITTTGDKDMSPVPLDTVGKGWFTKELDKALLEGRVDLTVHSLKDIPEELPVGLVLAAITKREDAREALISAEGIPFGKLRKGAVIGTDSTRRKSQILYKRPDIVVKSLRGNVNRRLEKLENGDYDGIFLAVAGLNRLGLAKRVTEYFDETDIVPSPGQGALALVVKEDNDSLRTILQKLNDPKTVASVKAERAFSKAVGGGCKMPVGAYAAVSGNTIILHGMIGSLDGEHVEKGVQEGSLGNPEQVGILLANRLLAICAPWYRIVSGYTVITRPEEDDEFAKKLHDIGMQTFSYPTIRIVKNTLSQKFQEQLRQVDRYDWIIFTSKHGVEYFMDTLHELKINPEVLQKKHIAAVGPKTAAEAKKFGLGVQFIPSEFTTSDLAEQLQHVKGKTILLARSNIATPTLTKDLKKKGAVVVNIPIYKTEFITEPNIQFEELLRKKLIRCLTFTSPSTIEGLLKSIHHTIQKDVLSLPVFSIGPVTTRAAKKAGFTTIYTAEIHTIDGMLTKLQESIL